MAEVIRTVLARVDLRPVSSAPEPVVMRGITLVPKHGTPVVIERMATPPRRPAGGVRSGAPALSSSA
jgi:hypothetical protein